ncbi:hypothetical protein CSA37_13400 [Candidatus Fermentibacteria bacterium]|nr:MAG: hypothetical protein CSA37_13400 [Candidatus Fermentibacteria bacterium]
MKLTDEVAEYYRSLAPVYHSRSRYPKTFSEADTGTLEKRIVKLFEGRRVLEIACGTGYWTSHAARSAKSVLATDLNKEMLREAENYCRGSSNVTFRESDAYTLEGIPEGFTGAFSVLWWCHMPCNMVSVFLKTLHKKLEPGSKVIHACQLKDMDTAYHLPDGQGNIIAERKLKNRAYRIVKNVPDEERIREIFLDLKVDYSVFPVQGMWSVEYTI